MHRRHAPALWTLLAATLLLTPTAPVAAQDYAVMDLGTLGGTESFAYDLNDRGEVVGGSQAINPAPGPLYLRRGFRSAQNNMTDLGALAPNGESRAFAINEQGWIAGWASDKAGDFHPALYAEGSWTPIPHPGIYGEGRGINDLGRVVGYFNDANQNAKAFAWSLLGTFVDLSLVDNAGNSLANAINHGNTVVGWSYIGPSPCGIFSASKPTVWQRDSSGNWSATGLPYTGCAGNVYGLNDWDFLVGEVWGTSFNSIPTQSPATRPVF
jgi:probable HAF family extracellular repeat protein